MPEQNTNNNKTKSSTKINKPNTTRQKGNKLLPALKQPKNYAPVLNKNNNNSVGEVKNQMNKPDNPPKRKNQTSKVHQNTNSPRQKQNSNLRPSTLENNRQKPIKTTPKQTHTNQQPKKSIKREISDNIIYVSDYDPILFFTVVILSLFGLMMIFSSSYYVALRDKGDMFHYLIKQGFAVALGFTIMIIAAVINYSNLFKKTTVLLYLASLFLLSLVLVMGNSKGGATRWIEIGPLNLQPSEVAKAGIIFMLSKFISDDISRVKTFKGLVQCGIIIFIPIVFVTLGKNLSTVIIMALIGGGMIFLTSPHTLQFIIAGAIAAVSGITYLVTAGGFRTARIGAWLDPFAFAKGTGYQIIQSLYAVASGGLFGLGLGQSRQKLSYIPEPQNDFIFAIICEELGFFGAFFVILLFAILIWRGMKIAINAPDLHGMLIASGIVIMITSHVLINIGVVTNTIPNTGVPLPLISYGGTSALVTLGLIGVLLNISRYEKKNY